MHITSKDLKRLEKKMGYKGCKNCQHQSNTKGMCTWGEQGDDGHLHLICPRLEKKE